MTIDLLISLSLRALLALNAGILLVLLVRRPALRWFGARSAYLLWGLPLAMMFAALLPLPSIAIGMLPTITVSVRSVAAALIPPTMDLQSPLSIVLLSSWLSGACIAALILWWQQQRFVQSFGELQRHDFGWLSQTDDAGPALVGALRPRIVLPADFATRYDARERELILAHEAVHLRRGDAQVNALIALLRCLNWFNPLIHYAASRFRFDQEVACDAAVLRRFPESARAYAGAMLKTQLTGESRQELRLPVGCHWQSAHPLKERIMLLKRPILSRHRRIWAILSVSILVASASAASWAMQPSASQSQLSSTTQTGIAGGLANGASEQRISNPTASMPKGTSPPTQMMHPPKFPQAALKALQSAKVILKIKLDAKGNPQSAEVSMLTLIDGPETHAMAAPEKAALREAFAKSAIDTAMGWKFDPAVIEGHTDGGFVLVPIDFTTCKKASDCDGQQSGNG